MQIYFTLTPENRLTGWGSTPSGVEGEISLEVADDAEVLINPEVFKYENGELIKDEDYQKELIDEAEKERNKPSVDEQLKSAQDALLSVMDTLIEKGGE